jgi:hypothetical protein
MQNHDHNPTDVGQRVQPVSDRYADAALQSRAAQPVDAKTLSIGVLSITACILFVGFLLVTLNPRPAYGIGMLDRVGDYIMFTQQTSNSTEHVIVVDAAVKRLNVYAMQARTTLELIQSIKLDRLPGSEEMENRKRGG